MKKTILAAAFALMSLATLSTEAQNKVYSYTLDDGYPAYGALRRVSPNGMWACGGDEQEQTGCFVVNTTQPEKLIFNTGGFLLDIDDNGMGVGSWYEKVGYANYNRAAVCRDNQWKRLPLPEAIIGQSYAVAISGDSRLIAGHGMCATDDPEETQMVGGKYYPILWELNDATGQYEVKKVYNNLYLPGTLGFYVYDISPNGRWICGLQCLDMGDWIEALLDTETGQLIIFHEIQYKEIEIEYAGTKYYKDAMFVDGILDGFDGVTLFGGVFTYATDRYIYGSRDIVTNVQPDGSGEISTVATIFDTETGEFKDGRPRQAYTCGVNETENFTTAGIVNFMTPTGAFNLSVADYLEMVAGIETDVNVAGIYSFDNTSKVLTGSRLVDNGLGDINESPVLVMLDDPIFDMTTGLRDITVGNDASITVDDGCIKVEGAQNICVYNLNGVMVSTGTENHVGKGVYIVTADGVSTKVAVK